MPGVANVLAGKVCRRTHFGSGIWNSTELALLEVALRETPQASGEPERVLEEDPGGRLRWGGESCPSWKYRASDIMLGEVSFMGLTLALILEEKKVGEKTESLNF
jgi:hypothetical protein